MRARFLNLLLATMLLAGCHRANQNEQADALENAYRRGLLSKDEYDAKKLALTPAAPAPVAAQAPAPAPIPEPPAVPTPEEPPPSPATAPGVSSQPVQPSTAPEPAPLAGCEDTEYKSGGKKGAEERFFAASPEAVRRAAISALDSLDFNIHKNSNKEIEASKRRHAGALIGAGGERVILNLEKTKSRGRSGTLVIGKTKKSFVGRVTQKTWTDAVLAEIACKLRESSR